jgi:hypothetical protein
MSCRRFLPTLTTIFDQQPVASFTRAGMLYLQPMGSGRLHLGEIISQLQRYGLIVCMQLSMLLNLKVDINKDVSRVDENPAQQFHANFYGLQANVVRLLRDICMSCLL